MRRSLLERRHWIGRRNGWYVCAVSSGSGRGDRECEAGADRLAGGYSEWITESCMVLISSWE